MRGLKLLCMPANSPGENKLSRLAFRIRGSSSNFSRHKLFDYFCALMGTGF
jgi:hypothetical protein